MEIFIIILIIFIIKNILLIERKKKKKAKEKIIFKKTKIINIGSSHSRDAFCSYKNKLDLSYTSQTLYYDYILIKKFIDEIDARTICFLTISYFDFSPKKLWLKYLEKEYYLKLDVSDFNGMEKIRYLVYFYFPIIEWIKNKLKIKEKIESISIEKRIKGHRKKLEENRNKDFNIYYLIKIIEECKKRGIKLFLLTTPFKKEYNNYFPKELLNKNFYGIIHEITKKYEIEYLDFSHEYNVFIEEDFSKVDYDHLSEKGSRKFIEELEKRLGINLR